MPAGRPPSRTDSTLRWAAHPDTDLGPAHAQRLALARLIVCNPTIAILDEATASVDPTTAGALERRLHAALTGRTVIAISHRLSNATHADRVLVMDAGVKADACDRC